MPHKKRDANSYITLTLLDMLHDHTEKSNLLKTEFPNIAVDTCLDGFQELCSNFALACSMNPFFSTPYYISEIKQVGATCQMNSIHQTYKLVDIAGSTTHANCKQKRKREDRGEG